VSKFLKALEQATRDRALRAGSSGEVALSAPSPAPVRAKESASAPLRVAELPDGVDEHLVSLVAPRAFEAEQYRALRHSVEHRHKTTGLRVLAVCSPGPGDGKTLTAINLAGVLAQAPEARVLLIDADLRRPSLGRLLGLGEAGDGLGVVPAADPSSPISRGNLERYAPHLLAAPGLVNAILEPRLGLDDIVQPRPSFNLSVICAGAAPASPYDVLKSLRLGELLDEARRRYDYIILDTPPLAPVQDCRVIGGWVDGFLLVVAALRTPRRLVEEALTSLDRTKILGLVFNDEVNYSILGDHSRYYYQGYYAPRHPSPNGHPSALARMVARIAGSLRHRRRRSASAKDRRRGGPR
jgi:Mrp family chromosome partitioning ATPase